MGGDTIPFVFGSAALTSALFGFFRPLRVFRTAAIALGAAIVGPFVIAFALSPLLGSGAGMGVALILYVVSALVATLAMSAALGAGVRHGWNALR